MTFACVVMLAGRETFLERNKRDPTPIPNKQPDGSLLSDHVRVKSDLC